MGDELLVLLGGEVVGAMTRDRAGADPAFTYSSEYTRDGTVALSARLPIATTTYPPAKVRPFLAGLVPENRETRRRWADRLGVSEDDLFAILSTMGWECAGAVQFCRPEDYDELVEWTGRYQPVDEAGIAERLRDLAADAASWAMSEEHWSLGGQQEKFALAWRDDRWWEAHGSAPTTHIVKPGIRTLHHQALVEHVTMTAASSLGVDVAGTRFVAFDDQWAIVVERFDRYVGDDGAVVRVHQEDFCQALGRLPEVKYESRGGPGLRDMMRIVGQQSADHGDDAMALADFLIVNAVAGAPDGHAKNISMLRTPGRNWIAPLYDLATGLVYDRNDVERSVAVSVGGERQLARIRAAQWGKAATVLGLPADTVRARVAQLADGFPAAFESTLSQVRSAPGADDLAARAIPALTTHCRGIVDRL